MEEEGDTQEHYRHLNHLISYNQNLLSTLGVSHVSLDEIATIAKSFGLHAKLTGAGGGGFAFLLLPPFVMEATISDVKEKLAKRGYDHYEANLGVNGVRVVGAGYGGFVVGEGGGGVGEYRRALFKLCRGLIFLNKIIHIEHLRNLD